MRKDYKTLVGIEQKLHGHTFTAIQMIMHEALTLFDEYVHNKFHHYYCLLWIGIGD